MSTVGSRCDRKDASRGAFSRLMPSMIRPIRAVLTGLGKCPQSLSACRVLMALRYVLMVAANNEVVLAT